jgi:hypothetical protein
VDSDYLFGNFLLLHGFRSTPARKIIRRSPPSCEIVPIYRTGGCLSVVTGAGDYVAEGDPDATVEFCELHLPDRMIVGRLV